MKKVLSILCVSIFLLGLSSCGVSKDRCPTVGDVEMNTQKEVVVG
jgi:hypothetical protein